MNSQYIYKDAKQNRETLTFDTVAAADAAAASAAAGDMVNASTSAKAAAFINEECLQVGLSPTPGSVASEGGALLAMADE